MKSLQVVTPHEKCIFNCPFCISKTHNHDNDFDNLYAKNYKVWKNNLIKVIKENKDLKYVVITGTNEPMQSQDCVQNIIDIVRGVNKDIQIEIQTHYYSYHKVLDNLDVVCYSISNPNIIKKVIPTGKKVRFVFILTDSFNNYTLNKILELLSKKVSEVTFKTLHTSKNLDKDVDKYILNHQIDNITLNKLKSDINSYNGPLSIRMDETCMNPVNRYMIFREDGNLYNDWDER